MVVGDTTLAEVLPLLEKKFGAWKAGDVPRKDIATADADRIARGHRREAELLRGLRLRRRGRSVDNHRAASASASTSRSTSTSAGPAFVAAADRAAGERDREQEEDAPTHGRAP